MRVFFLIVYTFFFYHIGFAQQPKLAWGKSFGGKGMDIPEGIFTDKEGNVYSAGYFEKTVDFDPGPEGAIPAYLTGYDFYFSKFDAQGNFKWVKTFGTGYYNSLCGSHLDQQGNFIFTGNFNGTVDFDPGTAASTLSASQGHMFILKLDANGNYVNVVQLDATNASNVTTDAQGNIIVCGSFSGTMDADPGPAIQPISETAADGGFIIKLDPELNFIWADRFDGTIFHLTSDHSGSIFAAGFFNDTTDFDPGVQKKELVAYSDYDGFLVKFDKDGQFTWVRHFGGKGYLESVASLCFDKLGNIFATGYFTEELNLTQASETIKLTSGGGSDIVVLKLNPLGQLIWVKQMGGKDDDRGREVIFDTLGNLFVSGYFKGRIDLNPGPEIYITQERNSEDIFLIKFNSAGEFIWASDFGGMESDYPISFAVDKLNSLYVTGLFYHVGFTYPDDQNITITSYGLTDIFILKFDQPLIPKVDSIPAPPTEAEKLDYKIYPNPCSEWLHVEGATSGNLLIYNSWGTVVMNYPIKKIKEQVQTSNLVPGLYFLQYADQPIQKLIIVRK